MQWSPPPLQIAYTSVFISYVKAIFVIFLLQYSFYYALKIIIPLHEKGWSGDDKFDAVGESGPSYQKSIYSIFLKGSHFF